MIIKIIYVYLLKALKICQTTTIVITMKTMLSLIIFWLIFKTSIAQMHNIQSKNQICIDLGTNNLLEPQSSITYKTAIQKHVIYSIQLRSSNTYYLISHQEHTLKPQAEFYYHPTFSKFTFLFGLGTSLNLQNQERVIQTSNIQKKDLIEPFISSTIIGSLLCFRYQFPIQLFASDLHSGIRMYPEIAYRYAGNASIYFRTELILDNTTVQNPSNFYQQLYIGIQRMF